jgi:uncharacterized membrane protein YjgN (DUF898 family)
MGIAVSDAVFVGKRRKFVRLGPVVFGLCLALVAGLAVWLYFLQPKLINFVEVARQIENGTLDQLSVELMAVMLPIAMLMCLVLLTAVIAFSWVSLSNERRYIRIIDELTR